MIIVQLTAKTIVSASRFITLSTRVVGVLRLHRFCTMTSIARTSAASVKSTVRFRGLQACQYNIPANELVNDDRKVIDGNDSRRPKARLSIVSNAFLPPRIITELAITREMIPQTMANPSKRTPPLMVAIRRLTNSLSVLIESSFFGASTLRCFNRLAT
jgi:hypothetical protein